jgi:hypothetical protein
MGADEEFVAWCVARGCELGAVELRHTTLASAGAGAGAEAGAGDAEAADVAVGAADAAACGRGVFATAAIPAGKAAHVYSTSSCFPFQLSD